MSSTTNITEGNAYQPAPPTDSTKALDRALPFEALAYIFSHLSNSGLQQAAWVSRSCCDASLVTARRQAAASVEAFTELVAGQLTGERHLDRREKLRAIGHDKRIFRTTSLLGIKSAQRAIGKEIALTLMGLSTVEVTALEQACQNAAQPEFVENWLDLAKAYHAIKEGHPLNDPNDDYVRQEDLPETMRAHNYNPDKARAEAYKRLLEGQLQAGNSLQVLVEMTATTQRGEDELLGALANLCIEKGLLDEAFRIAKRVSNTEIKDKMLGEVAGKFRASEQIERAVDAACAMSEGSQWRRDIIALISFSLKDQGSLCCSICIPRSRESRSSPRN